MSASKPSSELNPEDYYAKNYPEIVDRFKDAMHNEGEVISYPLEGQLAPDGTPLEMHFGILGAQNPERSVLVTAGVHAAGEEKSGAAAQLRYLETEKQQLKSLVSKKVRLVLCPTFNPHGASYNRRWGSKGEDLNRNFFPPQELRPHNTKHLEHYAELGILSLPEHPIKKFKLGSAYAEHLFLNAYKERRKDPTAEIRPWKRFDVLRQRLTGGQYDSKYAGGLFHGGTENAENYKFFEKVIREYVSARTIVLLDQHTGYGKWGKESLWHPMKPLNPILDARMKKSAWKNQPISFSGVVSDCLYHVTKDLSVDVRSLLQEIGTYWNPEVHYRLINEQGITNQRNQLEKKISPDHPHRQALQEMFCPESPDWRRAALTQQTSIIKEMVDYALEPTLK